MPPLKSASYTPSKRLILTGLVCTGLLASYLLTSSSEEDHPKLLPRRVDLTNLEPSNLPAQRDAVLTNFVVDARPVEDVSR